MAVRGARAKRFPMPRLGRAVLLTMIVLGGWKWYAARSASSSAAESVTPSLAAEATVAHAAMPELPQADISYTVGEGDNLADVFAGHDIPYPEIVRLEKASSEVFDLTNIRVGKEVRYALAPEQSPYRLATVIYQPDANRIIVATQNEAGWTLVEEPIIYDVHTVAKAGTVDVALYTSAQAAGLDDKIIMQMADTFAWDIDFARDTATGDYYKVIYEEKYLNGSLVTTGRMLAAEYHNKGKVFHAFLYQPDGQQAAYYTEDGKSIQRAFLKAPVNFRYVTSGFSMARFHPILGKVMPHDGVDYAAAYGTPIISIGDGVVTYTGWKGGYGNRIEIRHNEKYSSQYSHMSSYVKGLNVGDRVKQGDVVGYVGSTGFSTGNHVHFSMTQYGTYIDPASVDAPDGQPLSEAFLPAFRSAVQAWQSQLDALTTS